MSQGFDLSELAAYGKDIRLVAEKAPKRQTRFLQAVRVYSYAPHAHLIEEGHRLVTHDGREVGFVRGRHVFEVAAKEFEPEFYTDLDEMLDEELVEKL